MGNSFDVIDKSDFLPAKPSFVYSDLTFLVFLKITPGEWGPTSWGKGS